MSVFYLRPGIALAQALQLVAMPGQYFTPGNYAGLLAAVGGSPRFGGVQAVRSQAEGRPA